MESLINKITINNLEIISSYIASPFHNLLFKCPNSHFWSASLTRMIFYKYKCPICSTLPKYPQLFEIKKHCNEKIDADILRKCKLILNSFRDNIFKYKVIGNHYDLDYFYDLCLNILQVLLKKIIHQSLSIYNLQYLIAHIFANILKLYEISYWNFPFQYVKLDIKDHFVLTLFYMNDKIINSALDIGNIFGYRSFIIESKYSKISRSIIFINQKNVRNDILIPDSQNKSINIPEKDKDKNNKISVVKIETKEEKSNESIKVEIKEKIDEIPIIKPKEVRIIKDIPLIKQREKEIIKIEEKAILKPREEDVYYREDNELDKKIKLITNKQKFSLVTIDLNNMIYSMKNRFKNLRVLNPYPNIAKLLPENYIAYFFLSKQLIYMQNLIPKSNRNFWFIEDYYKDIKKNQYLDIDASLSAITMYILEIYHNRIERFILGCGDKDIHIIVDIAKKYKIPITIIVIEPNNLAHELMQIADEVVYLYEVQSPSKNLKFN